MLDAIYGRNGFLSFAIASADSICAHLESDFAKPLSTLSLSLAKVKDLKFEHQKAATGLLLFIHFEGAYSGRHIHNAIVWIMCAGVSVIVFIYLENCELGRDLVFGCDLQ